MPRLDLQRNLRFGAATSKERSARSRKATLEISRASSARSDRTIASTPPMSAASLGSSRAAASNSASARPALPARRSCHPFVTPEGKGPVSPSRGSKGKTSCSVTGTVAQEAASAARRSPRKERKWVEASCRLSTVDCRLFMTPRADSPIGWRRSRACRSSLRGHRPRGPGRICRIGSRPALPDVSRTVINVVPQVVEKGVLNVDRRLIHRLSAPLLRFSPSTERPPRGSRGIHPLQTALAREPGPLFFCEPSCGCHDSFFGWRPVRPSSTQPTISR
jgi:hypothetical protein